MENILTHLLRCRDLVFRFGETAVLHGAALDVESGESLALLGTSGSGKSTLLRIIAGLEVPEQGEVLIDGNVATSDARLLIAPHHRGVAMVFQDLALWPNLSVAENVRLGLSGLRLARRECDERIGEVLRLCEIGDLAHRRPGKLSGGQQQRVALARALSMRPKLLLLDEPLGGLDLVTKASVIGQLARLRNELGFAVILVTHDPVEVQELCDSLAVLHDGRIVERSRLEDFVANPTSELGRAFVATLRRGE
jgi:ABC-type Fe3+/spermidine/putrescine transport system ATPase subunit